MLTWKTNTQIHDETGNPCVCMYGLAAGFDVKPDITAPFEFLVFPWCFCGCFENKNHLSKWLSSFF